MTGPTSSLRPGALEPQATALGRRSPSPAGSEATEDEGQRVLEDMSASEMSDKNPAGRRRTSIGTTQDRRRVSLDIRLTVAERAAIRDRAQGLGVKPSAWGRAAMLDALDARRGRVERMHAAAATAPQPELAAAVEQLRRVGVNLNQAVRQGAALDDILLRDVLAAVDAVRSSLGDRTAT